MPKILRLLITMMRAGVVINDADFIYHQHKHDIKKGEFIWLVFTQASN